MLCPIVRSILREACQSILRLLDDSHVPPCFLDARYSCKPCKFICSKNIFVVDVSCLVWYEYVDAYPVSWLESVRGEPSEGVELVHGEHVVVG